MTKGMPERHTRVNIAERLKETTKEWNILDDQISGIVHDFQCRQYDDSCSRLGMGPPFVLCPHITAFSEQRLRHQ